MKQIKAPFLLKINFFTINFIFLFNLLIIQNFFTFLNFLMFILFIVNFLTFFFVLKGNIKYLKFSFFLPILYILFDFLLVFGAFKVYIYFLIRNDSSFLIVNIIFLVLFLSLLYYFVGLFLFYRRLKKQNLAEKYFTKEKQEKNYLISVFILVLLLLIFRFLYYERTAEYDIPKNFFETKFENEKFESDENLYIGLRYIFKDINVSYKTGFKNNVSYCLYEEKCYFEKEIFINGVNSFLGKYEISKNEIKILDEKIKNLDKEIKEIKQKINENKENNKKMLLEILENLSKEKEKLEIKKENLQDPFKKLSHYFNYNKISNEYEKLDGSDKITTKIFLRKNFENIFKNEEEFERMDKFLELSTKRYFKTNIFNKNENVISQEISRGFKFYFIYLLENKREKEFLEKVKKLFLIQEKIFNGDSSTMEHFVSFNVLKNILEGLDFILKNFKLSLEIKKELKNILQEFKIKKTYLQDSFKIEYLQNVKELEIKGFDIYDYLGNLYDSEFGVFNIYSEIYNIYYRLGLKIDLLGSLYDLEDINRFYEEKIYEFSVYDNILYNDIEFINPFKKNILGRKSFNYHRVFGSGYIKKKEGFESFKNEILEKLKE